MTCENCRKQLVLLCCLIEDLNLIIDGDTEAFSQLLDSVRDFTRVSHLDQVVVHGRDEEYARRHVAGASVVRTVRIFGFE